MDKQVKLVKITHFINPSRFYFRDLSKEQDELKQIERIEKKLAAMALKMKGSTYRGCDPKPKDMVAFYHNKKWIRCEVDENEEFSTKKILILWACDYGVPLHTSNFSSIFPLSYLDRYPRSMILVGGLSVMPATLQFDHVNCKQVKVFHEEWISRGVQIFREFVVKAKELLFFPSSKVSHPEINIGDLLSGDQSMVHFGLGSKLIEADVAIAVPDASFLKYHEKLFTNVIERWNDNLRFGGVLKNPEGVRNELVDLKFDKFNDSVADSSTDEYYISNVHQKVLDWQKLCDQETEDPDVFDLLSVSSTGRSNVPFHTIFKKKPGKVAKVATVEIQETLDETKFDSLSLHEVASVKSKNSGRSIFLAAGAPIQSTMHRLRKPTVQKPRTDTAGSYPDDEQFESVSQQSDHGSLINFD